MLIVVSDTVFRKDEADVINALFSEGLSVFHLRKPSATAAETESLIKNIAPDYHDRLSLHQHHQLAERFGIKRLHYNEQHRKETGSGEWTTVKNKGLHLSTSIHKTEEVNALSSLFDYAFFGPVFNSISKADYKAVVTKHFRAPTNTVKLVGVGGMDESNTEQAFQMGFAGVALLGAIWQSADAVGSFKNIKNICNSIVR